MLEPVDADGDCLVHGKRSMGVRGARQSGAVSGVHEQSQILKSELGLVDVAIAPPSATRCTCVSIIPGMTVGSTRPWTGQPAGRSYDAASTAMMRPSSTMTVAPPATNRSPSKQAPARTAYTSPA